MNQTIPVEAIKAAALFVARYIGRYAFHGLLLEHGRLVATDGRRLAVVEWKPAEGDVAPEGKPILPVDVIMQAAKVKGCGLVVVNGTMRSRITPKHGRDSDGPEFPYQVVEGEFPDVKAVMPRADRARKAEPVRLNPGFLADCAKAADIIQGNSDAPCLSLDVTDKASAVEFTAKGDRVSLRALLMPITS